VRKFCARVLYYSFAFVLAKLQPVAAKCRRSWIARFVGGVASLSAGRSNLTLSPRCATKHEPMCSASQLDERTSFLTTDPKDHRFPAHGGLVIRPMRSIDLDQ
jgi:hypothetical protein